MNPVVCLGDGYGGVTLMGVVRSLGRAGVPVHAFSARLDSPARLSRYCAYRFVPNATEEPELLERLLIEHAQSSPERPVLMVIGDAETQFVSARRSRLAAYYHVNVPSSSLVAKLIDKRQQYRAVEACGVSMPPTYYDVTAASARQGEFEFPLLIKPAVSAQWSHGRLKAVVADTRAQLEEHLALLERAGTPVVVQTMIPGPPSELYTVLSYIGRTGEPKLSATYRKVRQYPTDFGLAAFAKTEHQPELESATSALLSKLGFQGVCGVEYKRDSRDGSFRFVELNPRFELSNSLLARAGANIALAMYSDLTGGDRVSCEFRENVGWMALNLEWKACRELAARGEFSWIEWVKSLRGLRTEALFSLDDPLPGTSAYLQVVKNTFWPRHKSESLTSPRPKDLPT